MNEQDKYNDYDDGLSTSRRRRAARRGGGKPVADILRENEEALYDDTADNSPKAEGFSMQRQDEPRADKINIDDLDPSYIQDSNEPMADVYDDSFTAEIPPIEPPEDDDNSPGGKGKRPKKKKTPLGIFLSVLISIVSVYLIAIGCFAIYTYLNDDPDDDFSVISTDGEKPMDKISQVFSAKLPDRTSFVAMCTDEDGTRTDTIMVGCYNSVNKSISLISVPRDTIVSVSAANYKTMREEFPEPGKRTMKINAVHHYAGNEKGPTMLVDELNTLLDIDIDYYLRVDFDAFNYIIDSIGGIDYDVPIDMNYEDPTQDLAIHLNKGMQTLDGKKAEMLVRFRQDNHGGGYARGDLERIEVQQDFMKTLIKKVASVDTIKKNPKAYLTTFFKYVTTNAGLTDAIKYASALDKIDVSKLETYTLPGNIAYVKGISGYAADMDQVEELVYEIFKKPIEEYTEATTNEAGETEKPEADSKNASIQILNGGYTNGRAGEFKAKLEDEGFTVDSISDFNGERTHHTRIYTKEDNLGHDLTGLFNTEAEVITDDSITGDYDVVVIIGIDE